MKTQKTEKIEQPLDIFFAPKSVAVVGATENPGSVGRTIFWNLISNPFGGSVFPINPKRGHVLGIKAYKTLSEAPDAIELVVIVTPPPSVPDLMRECGKLGIKGVIIISAGFKEVGPAGLALEQEVLKVAAQFGIRVIGPNCLGVMSPLTGLNATFASKIARPGKVGFISQSGALCTAVLDWSLQANVGFSAFLSLGSMMDVGWGDLIHYLGNDPNTESIVIYMETIGDARAFLSAAREVALNKPIIVIKAGRTAAAAKAAASHTGSLAGSDDVLDAAFRRSGVLRVNSIEDLFYVSGVLAKQPSPKGPRLTILTNAGGPGVLATDALILGAGELTELSQETIEKLNAVLPSTWSHGNPIDIIGDAPPERYAKAVEIASQDPNSDGLLVVLTPQAMTNPTITAEHLKPYAKLNKPILASWMGGADVFQGTQILNQANIPTFEYPDTAVKVFNYMWKYAYNLKGIYETPSMPEDVKDRTPDRGIVEKIISTAHREKRTILTEVESKQLLNAYKIPTVQTLHAADEQTAVQHARSIGFPVVLKLFSETITHKTDVGGVLLNINDESEVQKAWKQIKESVTQKVGVQHFQGVTVQPMIKSSEGYEIIIGSSIDQQFGPVLLFGTGGQLVEVYKDRALALPPLNTTLARRMMEQTKIYNALKGVRGRKPVNLEALEMILVSFSQLVMEQRWIKEIDINPLFASNDRLVALDARVVLFEHDFNIEDIPKTAIRPYPTQYIEEWKIKNDEKVLVSPIRPEDEPLMVQFHSELSEKSVYRRYMHAISLNQRIDHDNLVRNCFIDYDCEIAMIAKHKNPTTGENQIWGVGRLRKTFDNKNGHVAVIVKDQLQGHGLGKKMMQKMIEVGKIENLKLIQANILRENKEGINMCKNLGFEIVDPLDGDIVHAKFYYK